jgi:HAE1 family hydrophobic/amphiphilic exporter-1
VQSDLENAIEALQLKDFVTVMSGDEAMGSEMGFGSRLDITVAAESPEAVAQATDLLFERLQKMDDIVNLETDLSKVVPTLDINLDSEEVAANGLVEQDLRNELGLLMLGAPVNGVSVDINGDGFGVFVKGVVGQLGFGEDPAKALALANALRVGGAKSVPLGDVATVALPERPTHVGRIDMNLAASITGEITAKDVGSVNRLVGDEIGTVEKELDQLGVQGVKISQGGVAEEMKDSFSKMGLAIIVAIIIAYLILVVTMRSILNPLIIMVSLPLASIGAVLGLLISGHTLGMSGMMGMLMLVGIVLTNAIVLIALVEQLRKQGVGTYDALVQSGHTRLRPILMTALTTLFAMVPLAFGVGGGTIIAAELAVVVIGGLFSSTVLTVIVIPVIYSVVEGVRQRRRQAG